MLRALSLSQPWAWSMTALDHRVTGHELIDAVSELIAAVKEPS